ncbi:hypothetical protein DWB58_11440 [candidate division KSB1 bacterium]|nr:hypothetical protein [candidate division KSB1 bacterium]
MKVVIGQRANQPLIAIIFLILIMQGCSPRVKSGKTDQFGCQEPPPDVFTSVGVDIKFVQNLSKLASGELNVKTNPQVISFASKAATDDRIRSYLRCLAIRRDKYTPEQAAYLERMYLFIGTQPTADQFIQWQKGNPFPASTDSSGTTHQYMINSPNSIQIKANNLTVIQDNNQNKLTPAQPFHLRIHEQSLDSKIAIEIRPGYGSWAPFYCAIPSNEVERTQLSVPITVVRGTKNRLPRSLNVSNFSMEPSSDGLWAVAWTDNEATPSQGYFVFFKSLPSKIAFGALENNSLQYVVDLTK